MFTRSVARPAFFALRSGLRGSTRTAASWASHSADGVLLVVGAAYLSACAVRLHMGHDLSLATPTCWQFLLEPPNISRTYQTEDILGGALVAQARQHTTRVACISGTALGAACSGISANHPR